MYTHQYKNIKKVISNILATLTTNDTTKEIAEAIALMELEETIYNMCGGV